MISSCLKFSIFWLMTAPPSAGGCFVHPTTAVAAVGEGVHLTCTTYENGSITSWDLGINALEKSTVYTAAVYKRGGSILRSATVSEGYFVTHTADSEANLHMNKTILSQAGLYVCNCNSRDTAVTTIVVLVSEPKFTTNLNGADGEPVTFSCSMSFNASSDVACELRIEDASGSTVARRNESTLKNGLIACNLENTVIAIVYADQSYTCNVTLSSNGDIIYSRVFNAAVEWELTSLTADALSTKGLPAETDKKSSLTLAIGLSVTIFAVVIIIAVVVYFIICSKKRETVSIPQRSMGQPAEQPSRCQKKPTNQYDKNRLGSPISATSCPDAALQDKKSPKDDELTVCENDLYGATSKHLDPSDGYFAEEGLYAEI